jgi:hypothetical protein
MVGQQYGLRPLILPALIPSWPARWPPNLCASYWTADASHRGWSRKPEPTLTCCQEPTVTADELGQPKGHALPGRIDSATYQAGQHDLRSAPFLDVPLSLLIRVAVCLWVIER